MKAIISKSFRFEGITSNPYISISGETGSGKSFLTNIIARKFYEKDILCLKMNLNQFDQNKKFSLGQFFTKHSCVDLLLVDEESKRFVEWIFKNQSRIILVFAGLDQLNKTIDLDKLSKKTLTFDDEATSGHWLASILSRQILTKTKIIVTSRPYALTCLCGDLRPQKKFKLDGFSELNFKKVLKFYIDNEIKLGQVYSTIKQNKLDHIVSNPISMYLITKIISDDQVDYENLTSFGLHAIVFEKLYATKNIQLDEKGNEKIKKIEETCYRLLMKSKFVFSQKDLVEGLTLEDFEKYAMVDASVTVSSYKNSIDEKRLVFCHQLVQVQIYLIKIY